MTAISSYPVTSTFTLYKPTTHHDRRIFGEYPTIDMARAAQKSLKPRDRRGSIISYFVNTGAIQEPAVPEKHELTEEQKATSRKNFEAIMAGIRAKYQAAEDMAEDEEE